MGHCPVVTEAYELCSGDMAAIPKGLKVSAFFSPCQAYSFHPPPHNFQCDCLGACCVCACVCITSSQPAATKFKFRAVHQLCSQAKYKPTPVFSKLILIISPGGALSAQSTPRHRLHFRAYNTSSMCTETQNIPQRSCCTENTPTALGIQVPGQLSIFMFFVLVPSVNTHGMA